MYIIQLLQAIGVLNIVLADNMKNICIQYLENIEILTYVKEQSFLNKEYINYIGSKSEEVKLYCKDVKLFKYSNNLFNDSIELQPLDNNQLLFEINDKQIIQYYAFIYESQHIKFMVKSMQIDLVQEENLYRRLLDQTIPVQSKLLFCQDVTCSIMLNDPKIYNLDKFYLQQIVTDPNYSDYYLTNTTVVYTSDGLHKSVTIEALDNSEKGKITMLIEATISWTDLQIQVYSSLSNTLNGPSLPYTTLSTIETTFYPLSSSSEMTCDNDNCSLMSSKLQVCSDQLCTKELDFKNIHYDDEIFVEQIVTIKGFQGYYLTNTTVYLIGNGLIQQNLPISIDYSEIGKALARLKVDVEWQITNITTMSYLSTTEPDSINSRLCQDWLCKIDLDLNKIQFNDQIFLEYRVSSDFYSTNIQIYYVGNGQIRKIHPEAIDNSERGRVIICFKVDTFLKEFTINVTCMVSKDAIGTSLAEYVGPIQSDIIECVKVNRDIQGCPTCEQECSVNPFSSCGFCAEDILNNILIILLFILFY